MNKKGTFGEVILCITTILLIISSAFLLISVISINDDNKLKEENEQLKENLSFHSGRIFILEHKIDELNKEVIEKDNLIDKLKQEVSDWRQTALDIINKMNQWYSSNPIVIEIVSHHSSSSSDDSNDEKVEVCNLTSDNCGKDEYLDASNCRCISRKPPIDETKTEVN